MMDLSLARTSTRLVLFTIVAAIAVACTPPLKPSSGPVSITGDSNTLKVAGEYQPVDIAEIERLTIENGKLMLLSQGASASVDLPTTADQPKPGEQWMLVTESEGPGERELTFTHEQLLDDFTVKLPLNGADLKYGTLSGKDGNDVVVFAWGREHRSYWGYVTIARGTVAQQ